MPIATVIIAYYRNLPYLKLVLDGLARQNKTGFEVILAEDDTNQETLDFLQQQSYSFPLKHLQNADTGFQKNKMLNKAIVAANSENLIFIDGDCIPHRAFVKNYMDLLEQGVLLYGRRVMLSHRITEKMRRKNRLVSLNIISLLLSGSSMVEEALYLPHFSLNRSRRHLCGCNWGIKKSHLTDINGFDEDYTHQGVGEDVDVEWRLLEQGLQLKSVRHKAIVYHLYHKRNYDEDGVQKNYRMLKQKQQEGIIVCHNGLRKPTK